MKNKMKFNNVNDKWYIETQLSLIEYQLFIALLDNFFLSWFSLSLSLSRERMRPASHVSREFAHYSLGTESHWYSMVPLMRVNVLVHVELTNAFSLSLFLCLTLPIPFLPHTLDCTCNTTETERHIYYATRRSYICSCRALWQIYMNIYLEKLECTLIATRH